MRNLDLQWRAWTLSQGPVSVPGLTELNAVDRAAAAETFTAGREGSTSTFCCATKHCVVRLSFCGLNNSEVVHVASDHPSGLIDVTVDRTGPVSADPSWVGIAAFC